MEQERYEKISPTTLALFEGTLGAVWGLALALVVLIQVTSFGAIMTDNLLQGMLFGLGTTAASLVAVPLLYFAIGAVLGYIHALVFNAVMKAMGRMEKVPAQLSEPAEPKPADEYHEPEEYREPAMGRGVRPEPTFGERIPEQKSRPQRAKRRL